MFNHDYVTCDLSEKRLKHIRNDFNDLSNAACRLSLRRSRLELYLRPPPSPFPSRMCCDRSTGPAQGMSRAAAPRRLPGESARGGGQLAASLNTVLVSGAKAVKLLP